MNETICVQRSTSVSSHQRSDGQFSKRESQARIRAARVRLVPLEQARQLQDQPLHADGYQIEARDRNDQNLTCAFGTGESAQNGATYSSVIPMVETLTSASNRPRKVITMVVTCLGFFMVLLDTSI